MVSIDRKANNMSEIAILLATYNGEQYIQELAESLRGQTCQDYICYIHDDGSTDGTSVKINEIIMRDPEHFQRLDYPSTGSAKANFLSMLTKVEAPYYMFCDQDDVWMPDKVEKTLQAMKDTRANGWVKAPQIDVTENRDQKDHEKPRCVFTDMYVTDAKLQITEQSFIRHLQRDPYHLNYGRIMMENPAAGCTMMINQALKECVLQYQELDHIEMHDVWMLAAAAVCGYIYYVDEPTVYYRQHGENEMGASIETRNQRILRNIKDLLDGTFGANKKAYYQHAIYLARELLHVQEVPKEMREELEMFAGIESMSKWKRIRFYQKHDISRNRHNLWTLLWV